MSGRPRPAAVGGVNHLTFTVADLDRSFAFYVETLGLTPLARWARGAYLLAGNTWVCLHLGRPEPAAAADDTHVAFDVTDAQFAALARRVTDGGAPIWQPNTSEGPSLYFRDPDGRKLEIHVGSWQSRLDAFAATPPEGYQSFVDD
ncbi:MAG: VOC family protein [Rhodospirillaceae bacterium]|nr:VOC family protein [Rhodospirillaceae bacterium]